MLLRFKCKYCSTVSDLSPASPVCPKCGQTLFKKSGRGRMKPFCINETCEDFLPEDKRGYYKKKEETHRMAEANKAFAHYRY